jgi:hypothetical protein
VKRLNKISNIYEALSKIGNWTLEVKPSHENPFSGITRPTMMYISCEVYSREFRVTNFVEVLNAITAEFVDFTAVHMLYDDECGVFNITLTDDNNFSQEDNHD